MFEGIPPDGLTALLKEGRRRSFEAGTHLFHEGDVCDSLFIILQGRVALARSHPSLESPVILIELGPAQVVGNAGLLDSEPRAAAALAMEHTEVVELSASALARALIQFPGASALLLRRLSRSLHTVDELSQQATLKGWIDVPNRSLPF